MLILKQKRIVSGSCSNCQERESEFVYEITLKTNTVRLCVKCLKILADEAVYHSKNEMEN